jgi:peptidylprolyl isomerase
LKAKALVIGAALAALIAASAIAAPPPQPKPPEPKPLQPTAADWRPADPAHTMVIDTNKGRIVLELYPTLAPNSVARLEALAHNHFYDGLTFFRVIDGFMDQTGDPKNSGEGGSTLPDVKAEFMFKAAPGFPVIMHTDNGGDAGFVGVMPVTSQPAALAALTADGQVKGSVLFCPGVVGIARGESPDSNNSQFFLMRGMKLELDEKYNAAGRVIAGQDVVDAIKIGEPVEAPQDRMVKVQMLADMAPADRPVVKVIDTRSAYFGALAKREKAAKGADFTPCDLTIASTIK